MTSATDTKIGNRASQAGSLTAVAARARPRASRALGALGITALALGLGACATVPDSPGVLVLPGTGKSFAQFRADDAGCRDYAFAQVGGRTSGDVAADSTARSAALGTVIGAAAGAAIGGGRGAGVGAGTGLVFGTAAGSGAASSSAYGLQRRYDNYFVQCMYAAGHRVPVSGDWRGTTMMQSPPAPPSGSPPPPPPAASPSQPPAAVPPPPQGVPPPPPTR